jgi:hypothetical protein
MSLGGLQTKLAALEAEADEREVERRNAPDETMSWNSA